MDRSLDIDISDEELARELEETRAQRRASDLQLTPAERIEQAVALSSQLSEIRLAASIALEDER